MPSAGGSDVANAPSQPTWLAGQLSRRASGLLTDTSNSTHRLLCALDAAGAADCVRAGASTTIYPACPARRILQSPGDSLDTMITKESENKTSAVAAGRRTDRLWRGWLPGKTQQLEPAN